MAKFKGLSSSQLAWLLGFAAKYFANVLLKAKRRASVTRHAGDPDIDPRLHDDGFRRD